MTAEPLECSNHRLVRQVDLTHASNHANTVKFILHSHTAHESRSCTTSSVFPRHDTTHPPIPPTKTIARPANIPYSSLVPMTKDEHGQAEAPMQAAAVTPLGSDMSKCKLASCTGSGCAWDSAPYLCTDGASAGGCAADASTWAPENGGCNAFCDLSGCSDTLKRAEVGSYTHIYTC